ncbi:hypothetical protein D9619_007014 [Psilocybe cf. subviscida]|uniref:Uncharacterized protein n=1 Tax=Psilocybe cf. subviscida TaxID=2480587 RepID=A0A8H5B208_9AGAR|nr:hypothetical protein D9619_007014 [Psilocybe cf. subviscida]
MAIMSTTMTQVPAVVPTATASNNMSSNPGLFNPASLNPTNSQPFTILRIKRKRTEEPLEALVVESTRRKKSRGGVGVFQYAQTVEDDAWNDAARQKHIQVASIQ